VEVTRGRKILVGSVGRCTWHGETKFGMRVRVMFDDAGARNSVFLDAGNVRRVEGRPMQGQLFGGTT
jgi:hypothetical protein